MNRTIIPDKLILTKSDNITDLHTASFFGDITEANLFRKAILSEIETYSIDIAIFYINTSPRHDELIAFRLGQLVIDHTKFIPPAEGDFTVDIDVGEGEFTTKDIKGLPFKYKTPIATLKKGQRIVCKCIVKKGQAKIHAKWRPVSKVKLSENENWIDVTIKTIGMMDAETIFREGYNKMHEAALQPTPNLYFRTVIPKGMLEQAIELLQQEGK